MFLLQLQLYVLTVIRVTLRRIQKLIMRQSTCWKFKYTILSKLRVQRKSVLQALYSDCSEWAIHCSIVLARIDFVSLYPPSIRLFPLVASMISRPFQTVRRMREAWKGETYVRSQSFSSESAVKYLHVGRRKIQISPGRTRSVKCPTPGPTKTIKSPPHALPSPRRHNIDRCINSVGVKFISIVHVYREV